MARLVHVETVPVVRTAAGMLRPTELHEHVREEDAVAWCNVLVVELAGTSYRLLHNQAAGA